MASLGTELPKEMSRVRESITETKPPIITMGTLKVSNVEAAFGRASPFTGREARVKRGGPSYARDTLSFRTGKVRAHSPAW